MVLRAIPSARRRVRPGGREGGGSPEHPGLEGRREGGREGGKEGRREGGKNKGCED